MSCRILIVGPSWVGDMVMAQALVQVLAERVNAPPVDMLAPDWVAGLVSRMPGVADVLHSPFRHGELAWSRRRQLARELAGRGYSHAIVLPNSAKSALAPWLAGISRRTGFRGEWRFGLLNDVRRFDPERVPRLVDRFVMLAVDREAPAPRAPEPRLAHFPERTRAARERHGLGDGGRVVALCPGAEFGPAKRWPVRHFATLARALARQGVAVWLLGSARDASVTTEIASSAGVPVANLAGRTTLEDAVDLLAAASTVVSNDSGLMHVAAAVGTPVVALYGSSSPDYTPPLSGRATILRNPVPCSPCFERECPLGHFRCLNDLSPDRVLARVVTILEDCNE